MKIETPDKSLTPDGSRLKHFGGPQVGQPEYLTLPAIVTPCGWLVSQWLPNAGELALLNAGAPLTLAIRTGGSCPPTTIVAGGIDLRRLEVDTAHHDDLQRFADDGGPAHD